MIMLLTVIHFKIFTTTLNWLKALDHNFKIRKFKVSMEINSQSWKPISELGFPMKFLLYSSLKES